MLSSARRFIAERSDSENMRFDKLIACCLFLTLAMPALLYASEKDEIQYLKNELSLEKEASKVLSQKLLKSYEEKVILENQVEEKDRKIKDLEDELAKTRGLMESEVNSYRKKIGILQIEIDELNKRNTSLDDKSKIYEYITMLEEDKKRLKKELAEKQVMLDKIKKEIESVSGKNGQGDIDKEAK